MAGRGRGGGWGAGLPGWTAGLPGWGAGPPDINSNSRARMAGWQFPQWNYGHTQMPGYYLGPPQLPGVMVPRPTFLQPQLPPARPALASPAPPVRPPLPAAPHPTALPVATAPVAVAVAAPPIIKAEAAVKQEEPAAKEAEGGAGKSILGVLKGRNPVMFCNDQSKMRGLHMEWEQVSEAGPPHDKTYQYQLKMGELAASGTAKNKKDAKTKAAEAMVMKLDELPRVNKRPFQPGGWGGPHGGPHGGPSPWGHQQGGWGEGPSAWGRQGGYQGGGRGGFHQGGGGPAWKKRKGETEDAILKKNDVTPKAENPSQNNPISKLYEYTKKRRWPEPIFDCVSEEVLEERRTEKGFTLRKTNFSLRCTIRLPAGQGDDKTYVGNALTKKQAKTNAASAAWAELNSGVTQTSVDSLLSEARGGESAGPAPAPAPAVKPEPVVVTPAQPKITMHKPGWGGQAGYQKF